MTSGQQAVLAELLVQLLDDLLFDGRPEHAQQEAEFGVDVDFGCRDVDRSGYTGPAELQRVAGPLTLDVEFLADRRCSLVDGSLGLLERLAVLAPDFDAGP